MTDPCPQCGGREPCTDPRMTSLAGGSLYVCACGAIYRGAVFLGRASLGPDGHVGIRAAGRKPRRFRYLGYGHFRLTKG